VRVSNHLRFLTGQPLNKSSGSQAYHPRPISGWTSEWLLRFDEAFPGGLRRALIGSPLRRQGIFISLIQLNVVRPQDLATKLRPLVRDTFTDPIRPMEIVGQVLVKARVRDIVRALYGPVEGLVGALGRLGSNPLAPEDYRALIEIHADPRHRSRVRVLRNMTTITGQSIRTLMALKPPYLLPILVRRLGSVQQAEDFECSVELIKRLVPEATDADLLASLEHLRPSTHIREWVTRWLHRATVFLNDPPIRDDDEFVLLNSASAIRDAARRYSNCLKRDRLVHCALGREGYVEHLPSQTLVELRILDRGAVLEGLHRPRNSFVDVEAARRIITGLQNRGVLIPVQLAQPSAYRKVARFARIYDLTKSEFDLIEPANRIELRLSHGA
jgi:hypothetical protein